MSENPENGERLLPVCIETQDITEIISALDLYRMLKKDAKTYPAFQAVMDALPYYGDAQNSPCFPATEGQGYGNCYRFNSTSEIFQYYPNNPHDSGDDGITSFGVRLTRFDSLRDSDNIPDWLNVVGEYLLDRSGYFDNDVFLDYPISGNPFSTIEDFWNGIRGGNLWAFPIVKFEFEGTGQAEIEFLSVPFGGGVVVTWDLEPTVNQVVDMATGVFNGSNQWDILELGRDVIGFPPELISTVIKEIEFESEGTHTVSCWFYPAIQPDTPPFVFPFGGIREVEFCGNIKVVGGETGELYDQTNYKDVQVLLGAIELSLSYDQMVKAIRVGNNLSKEDIAKRVLYSSDPTNIRAGIDIDPVTGNIGIKEVNFGAQLPDGVSNQDVAYGGALSQAQQFWNIFKFIADSQTSGVANAIVQRGVRSLLSIDESDSALVTEVNTLVTDYLNQATKFTQDSVSLANDIFFGSDEVGGVFDYALDTLAGNETEFNLFNNFAGVVSDSKWLQWFNAGTSAPAQDYRNDSRFLGDPFTFKLNSDTTSPFGTGDASTVDLLPNLEVGKRYLLKITGKVISSDGTAEYDGMYKYTSSGDAYSPIKTTQSNGVTINTPVSQPSPSESGYLVEYSITGMSRLAIVRIEGWTGEINVIAQPLRNN